MMKLAVICDFLWVLQAFLRGKLLRQKAYRPGNLGFRLPVTCTVGRMVMLARWWGYRPLTLEEAQKLMSEDPTAKSAVHPPVHQLGRQRMELQRLAGRLE